MPSSCKSRGIGYSFPSVFGVTHEWVLRVRFTLFGRTVARKGGIGHLDDEEDFLRSGMPPGEIAPSPARQDHVGFRLAVGGSHRLLHPYTPSLREMPRDRFFNQTRRGTVQWILR